MVQFLLKYLYTGECIFPRDDLNLALELMAAADQFLLELMKQQCERVLCEKIDLEVCIKSHIILVEKFPLIFFD